MSDPVVTDPPAVPPHARRSTSPPAGGFCRRFGSTVRTVVPPHARRSTWHGGLGRPLGGGSSARAEVHPGLRRCLGCTAGFLRTRGGPPARACIAVPEPPDGTVSPTVAGTPQGGVISPLLSNIYLHVLDVLWTRHSAPYGTLVRYADDFVVMCRTKKDCELAEQRIRVILTRLGLELHPDKTRRVVLYDGKQGFDFLGCHLHKRMSGKLWEEKRERAYFLQRWPSKRSMQRIRQRVKEIAPKSRCHADIRDVIADLNPVLRGWGNYFRTGNAAKRFNQLDGYVWRQLRTLRVKRKGRHSKPGEANRWTREYFENLGLHRLRGTVRYPEQPFWKWEAA